MARQKGEERTCPSCLQPLHRLIAREGQVNRSVVKIDITSYALLPHHVHKNIRSLYICIYIYICIRARIGICIYVYFVYTCTGGPDLHSLRYNILFFSSRLRLRLRTKNYNLSESSRSGPKRENSFIHPSVRTHNHHPPQPSYGRRLQYCIRAIDSKNAFRCRKIVNCLKSNKLFYL